MRIKNLRTPVSSFVALSSENSGGDYPSAESSNSTSPMQENSNRCSKQHTQRLLASFTKVIFCPWSTLNVDTCAPEEYQTVWTSSWSMEGVHVCACARTHVRAHTYTHHESCWSKHTAFLQIKPCLPRKAELGSCKTKEMVKPLLRLRKSDTHPPIWKNELINSAIMHAGQQHHWQFWKSVAMNI